MDVEVLISCMNEKDTSIIQRENIQSNVLVINQCNVNSEEEFYFNNLKGEKCKARFIYTTERGLSRSRNMAIKNASGNICLLCDDDEIMENDYVEKITSAFNEFPKYDIIVFKINHPKKKYNDFSHDIGFFTSAKIGSIEIAFRNKNNVTSTLFNIKMGSGSGNGAGEENKFLIDNIKNGLKVRYVPYLIASVSQTESFWFHGYTEKYWRDRGWTSKMIYGKFWGYFYLLYVLLIRAKQLDKVNSFITIFSWSNSGFFEIR